MERRAGELVNLVFQLALREHRTEVARALAWRRRTQGETLARLAQENDEQVYFALARHPHTPIRILWRLAQTDSERVRMALTRNPNTPFELLETLCDKLKLSQLRHLVTHANVTPEKRASLYALYFDTELTRLGLLPSAYRNEALNALMFLRLAAFASPALSPAHYAEGAQSYDWRERCTVAFNPTTPRELLEELAHDGHIAVRANAQATLAHLTTSTDGGSAGNAD